MMVVSSMLRKIVMARAKLKALVAHIKSAIFARIREALSDAVVGCFNKRREFLKKVLPKNAWGDRIFGKLLFFASHRRLPTDFMRFNDVLHRIKTTSDIIDPLRVFVTDKEFVKIYINAVAGTDSNVPTLGIVRNRADVQSYDFPTVCCIKPTHLSGHYIIRKNGE